MPPASIDGVLTVLATPFHASGEVDLESLARLVEHSIEEGSAGLVCFGLAGELYKLDDDERTEILATVARKVDGRVPVIAGSESNGIEAAVRRTALTIEMGASAVMVLPPSFVKPDPATTIDYYVEVGAAAEGRPVIVQDAPSWTGVPLPVPVLAAVRDRAPNVGHVKVENPPNAGKIRELRAAGFGCVGGFGALHLLEDHRAGIDAVMPGAGTIAANVELWHALRRADGSAWPLYEKLLPLLVFQMASLDTFVAVQKELLVRRGVIAGPTVRRPGRALDEEQRAWLAEILQRLETGFRR